MPNHTEWLPWADTNKRKEEWDQDRWAEVAIDADNPATSLVSVLNTPSAQVAIGVVNQVILLEIALRAKETILTIHNQMASCESIHPTATHAETSIVLNLGRLMICNWCSELTVLGHSHTHVNGTFLRPRMALNCTPNLRLAMDYHALGEGLRF